MDDIQRRTEAGAAEHRGDVRLLALIVIGLASVGCDAVRPMSPTPFASVAPGPDRPRLEPPRRGDTEPPRRYICRRRVGPIVIDGRLDDPAWSDAPWTEPFVDIEGAARPSPRFQTRARLLWDEEHLFIAAELEEPHVWATLAQRDQVVFHDNDFEVFIDADGDARDYAEIEINALNTIFDLLLRRPYAEGGGADHAWNVTGLRHAVHVDGTLNDPSDVDQGWTLELAIPFAALDPSVEVPTPPWPGDVWRINFSRVQWQHVVENGGYRKVPDVREDNWSWSPQHEINMHRPRRWGYVEFR